MSHWAEIDETNFVIRVVVGDNDDINGDEGYEWIVSNLGGNWIKTSYNGKIRKNFAAVGYIYDVEGDAFYSPQPFESWKLDRRSFTWKAPVPKPNDGKFYLWNETTLSWEEISN